MKVIPIYEAKSQFSKLVKRAQAGETIYIGAYGKPEAVIAPIPKKIPVKFGFLARQADPNFDLESEELWAPDESIMDEIEKNWERDEQEEKEWEKEQQRRKDSNK